MFLASGVSRLMKLVRRAIWTSFVKRQARHVEGPLFVNARSRVTAQTMLGANVHFNGMRIGGTGEVTIGDNFHSGAGCSIITQVHNYNGDALPYDNTYVLKSVTIGDNVWLGQRVMILGGVSIGDGAIIQAGSVVVKDVPPLAIAGGHPAEVFGQRDREHYERLVAERRFM